MEPEQHRGQVHGQEGADEVSGRVVVGCAHREWGRDLGVVPAVVEFAEDVRVLGRMQDEAVQGVSEELAEGVAA
jgi:hypothetical protein